MATNIDERIVAAKFDASDFEKGVDKTCKKLDELKKSLDLKDAAKGVKELAEKTEASTDSMSKSLDKLTERFTTFVGMIKQKILSGLADEVASVFFKIEQSVKSLVKSVSIDQISAGLDKYQSTLTSVRQMVNAGWDEEKVYSVLERIRTYTDQTSYSFEQMSDAMSKMVAAGVDIDQAAKNVEGIANACANAGINATDAQRAFFNLSQAFTKGKLEYTDYKSLEILNMTNKEFTEQCMEAAVQAKTLIKSVDKLGNTIYKTSNKVDKKVKGGKVVTLKNFTDSLKYDFMNTEAMNQLFGSNYWMEIIDKDELQKLRKELGDEEFEKRFGKIASKAFEAAYEARSFLDVINAIKDAASSGWSKTFEYLFGRLDDAKNFFTDLSNSELADVIYKLNDYRNALLEVWDNGVLSENVSGGIKFRESILNVAEALGVLLKAFLDVLPGFNLFDQSDEEDTSGLQAFGRTLFKITVHFNEFSERLKTAAYDFRSFMNEPVFKNGPSKIDLLRTSIANITSVFKTAGKVLGIAFRGIGKIFKTLNPVFNELLIILSKVTQPLTDLSNDTKVFNDLEYTIDNICIVLKPVAEFLGEILGFVGDIAKFIAQMALDTFTSNISFFADILGLIVELITGNSAQMKAGEGILDGIRQDFEGIKEACEEGLGFLNGFFDVLLGDIRQLFGLTDEADKKNQNGGVFSGLTNFFNTNEFVQKAKKWVDQAIIDVGEFVKSIPSRVMALGANIYGTLRSLFFSDETNDKGETTTVLTPLGQWCDQAIKDIKAFIVSIPQRIIDGVGKITNWIDEVFNYWFGTKKGTSGGTTNIVGSQDVTKNTNAQYDAKFTEFINNAKASITEWFDDLPNKIQTAFTNVGNFFTNLYKALDEFLFGKKVRQTISVADGKGGLKYKDITVRYKSGFSKWLDGVIKDIKKFISNIPEYIKKGVRGAGDIITTVVAALFGRPDDDKITNKDISEELAAPFLGIDINGLLTEIQNIGKEILSQIARIFTGSDDVDANMNWFSETIAKGINWIREKALEALTWLTNTLANIPTTIANLFTGKEDKTNPDSGPVGNAISEFGKTIGIFISETLPATILGFINSATEAFDEIWTNLYNKLIGDATETTENASEEVTEAVSNVAKKDSKNNRKPTAWEKFVKNLGETIGKIWEDLPVWIANGIDLAIKGINDLLLNIDKWLFKNDYAEETQKSAEENVEKTLNAVAEGSKEGSKGEEPRLITAIKGIGERIKELFVATIPGFIRDAFKEISALGSDLYTGIHLIFSGGSTENVPERVKSIASIGNKIKEWIVNDLPGFFNTSWTELAKNAGDIFQGIRTVFTGEAPVGEVQKAANEFGTKIYKTITETIPNFISKAFAFIGNLFGGSNGQVKDVQQSARDKYEAAIHAVKGVENEVYDKADKEFKKPNKQINFFDDIKENLLKAFAAIGPGIMNGLANAFDWISNIVEIVINHLSGKKSIKDQINETYGDKKPELVDAFMKIGESLKNFFLDVLPRFLGSILGNVQRVGGEWFAKLFGAMKESAEAEGEKAFGNVTGGGGGGSSFSDQAASATGLLDIVMNVLSSVKDWVGENQSFIEIIGVILALTLLFTKLSYLFSLADELWEVHKTVQWTAITIAIIAISGIMSFITQLVNSGDTEKIDRFEGIIDKLGDLFQKLSYVTGTLALGKLFKALGTKWGDSSGSILDIIGGLGESFNGFLGALSFSAGTYVVGGSITATIDNAMSTLSETFIEVSSDAEEAGELIGPMVDTFANMDDKISKAIDAVTKVKDLFAAFLGVFADLYEAAGGSYYVSNNPKRKAALYHAQDENGKTIAEGVDKELVSMQAFIVSISEKMDLFMQISVVIKELGRALDSFENKQDVEEKIDVLLSLEGKLKVFFSKFINMLKTAIEGSNLSPEYLGSQYTERTMGMVMILDMLADALSVFGVGISDLSEDKIDALSNALDVFARLGNALSSAETNDFNPDSLSKVFFGKNSLAAIGNQIKLFGMYMNKFYGYIASITGFSPEQTEETNRKVDAILYIAGKLADSVKLMLAHGAQIELLNTMSSELPEFGEAIGKMYVNINKELPKNITKERAEILDSTIGFTTDLLIALNELSRLLLSNKALDVSSIMDKVFGGMSEDINVNKFAALITAFDLAISKVMGSEDFGKEYESIGSNLATRLVTGIQSALDSDPTLRITPVLNLDTAEQQLRSMFGVEDLKSLDFKQLYGAAAGSNDQVDEDRVKWSALSLKIDEVSGAINTLAEAQPTLNDLTNAFSKLKMYINKNTLVGEITDDIDYHIGLKINLLNGNITP